LFNGLSAFNPGSARLRQPLGIAAGRFYRLDTLLVTQPTALKQRSKNMHITHAEKPKYSTIHCDNKKQFVT